MSYTCLIVSSKGAVAASDSRNTKSFTLLPVRLHFGNKQKTFFDKNHRLIWAQCGISSAGLTNIAAHSKRILENPDLPFTKRLELFKERMKKDSLKYQKMMKSDAVSNLIYACYENPANPIIGNIYVVNGKVTQDSVYKIPTFLQSGSNASELSSSKAFIPDVDSSVEEMAQMAEKRVLEAIEYDRIAHEKNRRYNAAVGGAVQIKKLKLRD